MTGIKVIQVIRHFYTEKQYITVARKAYSEQAKTYDPERIRNIDFENSIGKGTDTLIYRAIADSMLWQMLQGKLITFEMFLEHSSLPFADKLMESVKQQQEQMAAGQMLSGIPPELVQQIQAQQQNQ